MFANTRYSYSLSKISVCGEMNLEPLKRRGSASFEGIVKTASVLFLAMSLLFIVCACGSFAFADESETAESNGHSKTLTPGEEYDVSTASANTTVYIRYGGTYTLKGKSSNMHVEMNTNADVTIILADGLNIDTSATSGSIPTLGARTPAINICDFGGTVTILTTPGGTAKLSGYLGSPAIQKDGTKTKLVFDTQDHSKWGTLNATGSRSVIGGAGIGTSSHEMIKSPTTGNIVIESGTINATGGINCAGIGGGDHGNLNGLTINGGTVKAYGGGKQALSDVGGGAGIGGGTMGSAYNITINGGTVKAYGGHNGAGIGGGNRSSNVGGEAHNIVINGGKVHASGNWGGSGIGGAWEGDASGITIAGGTVEAYGGKAYSTAIGGGGGAFAGTGSNITISGGVIKATCTNLSKHDAVIGSNYTVKGTTSVNITGGQINVSGNAGYLIGGGGKHKKVNITISGGTIASTGKATKIGGHGKKVTISILGGSVNANMSDTPVNQKGDKLSLTTVTLSNASKGAKVNSITTEGISPAYGMKDVYTLNDDKLYFWFPNSSKITRATAASGTKYGGEIEAKQSGTLYPATTITIDPMGGTGGSAIVFRGDTRVSDYVAPTRRGYKLATLNEGPNDGDWFVVDYNGVLIPSIDGFTDKDAKWIYEGTSVTLYARWNPLPYKVHFDSNVPTDASTSVSGETADLDKVGGEKLVHGTEFTVPSSGYALPGYEFDSWNTKADGTGTHIEAGSTVEDLDETSDGVATLYAIWKPCEYTVTFEDGETSGSSYTQTMTFDEPTVLTSLQFDAPAGKAFLGWTSSLAIGSMWQDGTVVTNLCALGEDGKPVGATLTAKWAGTGHVSIVVTRNGVPASGLGNALTLAAGGGIYGYFDEDPQAPGVYTLKNVAPGTYGIGLNGFKTTGKNIEVAADGSGMAWLDYCDVQITSDKHCEVAFASDSATQLKDVPVGSTLGIKVTGHDTGYRFSEYTATGTDPTWQDGDTTLGTQTITVNGQTTIQAHSNPIHYKVVFDAGGGVGGMVDQTFEYDSSQKLSLNAFSKNHSSFACWTLTPKWSGTTYADQAEVLNLASEEGDTVTLYAQYTADSWWVEFNGNGGDVGYMDSQKMFFGTPSELEKSTMTMEDCTFRGWNTEADGTGQHFDDEAEVLDLATYSDEVVTLWAQWERDYYTIVFDANDGSGETHEQKILVNDDDELDGNMFVRDGYTFVGWNTAADGTGSTYMDGAEVFGLVDEYESITLYAQWKRDYYTVVFDANDGSGETHEQKILTNDEDELDGNTFTRDGYTFLGWNTAADGTGTEYADGAEVFDLVDKYETITLYAQWEKIPDPDKIVPDADKIPDPVPDADDPGDGTADESLNVVSSIPNSGDELSYVLAGLLLVASLAALGCIALASGADTLSEARRQR